MHSSNHVLYKTGLRESIVIDIQIEPIVQYTRVTVCNVCATLQKTSYSV